MFERQLQICQLVRIGPFVENTNRRLPAYIFSYVIKLNCPLEFYLPSETKIEPDLRLGKHKHNRLNFFPVFQIEDRKSL